MKFNVGNTVGNILKGQSSTASMLKKALAPSGISRTLAMSTLNSKTTADIYMTDIATGERVGLAWIPDDVSMKCSTNFQSYDIIEVGEIKVPKGERLTGVSWHGVLPGEDRKAYPFIKSSVWQSPKDVEAKWKKWRNDRRKLKLMVTQTAINLDVYLQDYDIKYKGGNGDAEYSISFVAAKDLIVKTVAEMQASQVSAGSAGDLDVRAAAAVPGTCTVSDGDSLWAIAEEKLGDGSRWNEIYELNQDKIDDPDTIYPGQDLTLPT